MTRHRSYVTGFQVKLDWARRLCHFSPLPLLHSCSPHDQHQPESINKAPRLRPNHTSHPINPPTKWHPFTVSATLPELLSAPLFPWLHHNHHHHLHFIIGP